MIDRGLMVQDIADIADQLLHTRELVVPVYGWTGQRNRTRTGEHRVRHASLLDELAAAAFPGQGDHGRAAAVSRPPVNLDAVSKYLTIQLGVVRLSNLLDLDLRDTLTASISGIVGASATTTSDLQAEVLREIRRWRRWAAIAVGWESPPRPLTAPCPVEDCNTMGSLRMWAGDRNGTMVKEAWCETCGTRWTDEGALINLAKLAAAYDEASKAEAAAARARARADKARTAAAA